MERTKRYVVLVMLRMKKTRVNVKKNKNLFERKYFYVLPTFQEKLLVNYGVIASR